MYSVEKNLSFLVVDDSTSIRDLVSDLLISDGCEDISHAVNGLDAIKKVIEKSPNIIVLDVEMPILNGIDAAKEIKRISPESYILYCSSCRDVINMNRYGDDYIQKPFSSGDFLDKIRIGQDIVNIDSYCRI